MTKWIIRSLVPLEKYASGRVALCGDAVSKTNECYVDHMFTMDALGTRDDTASRNGSRTSN